MAKYDKQIVIFLDILGFSSMLPSFERTALLNHDETKTNFHQSVKLNKLLDIFEKTIKFIDSYEGNHYLFSDNICITLPYVEKEDTLVTSLLIVNRLYRDFGEEGYYLRGGIDVGWFLDNENIAVGVPLVNAYLLESQMAEYPRILLSNNIVKLINNYVKKGFIRDDSIHIWKNTLTNEKQINYINPFAFVLSFEDKESKIEYLRKQSHNIKKKLLQHAKNRKVKKKYTWLKNTFNNYIRKYCKNHAILEFDIGFTNSEINKIENLKI